MCCFHLTVAFLIICFFLWWNFVFRIGISVGHCAWWPLMKITTIVTDVWWNCVNSNRSRTTLSTDKWKWWEKQSWSKHRHTLSPRHYVKLDAVLKQSTCQVLSYSEWNCIAMIFWAVCQWHYPRAITLIFTEGALISFILMKKLETTSFIKILFSTCSRN